MAWLRGCARGRDNVEVGLKQALGAFNLKMIYARNDQAQHNYKTLNYEQARNLDQYRDEDYSRDRSSNDYYGYNRQDFRNQALVAELSYDFSPTTRLVFKPFWAQEEGYYLFAGSQPNQVLNGSSTMKPTGPAPNCKRCWPTPASSWVTPGPPPSPPAPPPTASSTRSPAMACSLPSGPCSPMSPNGMSSSTTT